MSFRSAIRFRTFRPNAELPADKWEPKKGMNRFVWDLRYPAAESFPGMILWGGLPAPRAVPGKYQVRLTVGGQTFTQPFTILPDPRLPVSEKDLQAQFDLKVQILDRLS